MWIENHMWRSSGVLYLPYIFRTLKRVYKPTVVISTKLLKMSSFCPNMACGYRERAGLTWATSMCGECCSTLGLTTNQISQYCSIGACMFKIYYLAIIKYGFHRGNISNQKAVWSCNLNIFPTWHDCFNESLLYPRPGRTQPFYSSIIRIVLFV